MRLDGLGTALADATDTRPWYIKLRDWAADSAVVNAAVAVQDYTVQETQAAIKALYDAGNQFHSTYTELQNYADAAQQSPDLATEYSDLVSRGNYINTVISDAVASVQSVVQWVKDNVGTDISGSLQGLGFVQLIPAAILGAVVAATALAVAWITDARSAITKIQALQQLANSVPPEQRADVITAALKQSGGLTETISKTTTLLVVGGVVLAGVFFAPQIKRLLSKGN
jgi:hypothetical protein